MSIRQYGTGLRILGYYNILIYPRPVGRPHYTWKDGAMQDLNALGPRLQQLDLLRDWPKLALDRELWREVASRC